MRLPRVQVTLLMSELLSVLVSALPLLLGLLYGRRCCF